MDRIYTETNASRPGDVLFLPAAFFAFWTIAYQIVLVARWPVWIIIPVFLATGVSGSFFAARFLRERAAMPGHGYRFHQSHFLLVVLAAGSAITPLFLLRPNQDDVVYFHRALSQLSALSQPILTRQTSVDVDAAAFSPVHLATSHEMLLAFFGHFVGIDPLYCYQVVGHAVAAFFIPLVFYWCVRRFGLERWPAAIGAGLGIAFLLIDDSALRTFGHTAFGRMWQGKAIVWVLFPPVTLALTYRFLREGNLGDVLWLGLVAIAGVGLSSSALYLIPAVMVCSCLAYLAVQLFTEVRSEFWRQLRRCCLLAFPLLYPLSILVLLKLNIIPKPINLQGFGPLHMPWREAVDYVVGSPWEYLRDVTIFVAIPLLIVGGTQGLFLFFYLCAVWLLCLNPLFAHRWMEQILAACYFRLVYLLPLPLLCAMIPAVIRHWSEKSLSKLNSRLLSGLGLAAVLVVTASTYPGLIITSRNPMRAWKSPSEYQLLRANVDFAHAAGKYIAHSKLLAPGWTASCELPLLFPSMKIVAPRLAMHYFANAGKSDEGALRRMAQAFVEGETMDSPERAGAFAASFRKVIKTGRATAVAATESESKRVLGVLKTIDPRWHRVLAAGGLVLMLPGSGRSADRPQQRAIRP